MHEGTKKSVNKLSCKVCRNFKSRISGRRNYSDKWVEGASSVRTSNIKDHAQTDQHLHAMTLLKKESENFCRNGMIGLMTNDK